MRKFKLSNIAKESEEIILEETVKGMSEEQRCKYLDEYASFLLQVNSYKI